MVLGMSLPAFTAVHVLLSLVGIVAGFIAMRGLVRGILPRGWTWLFLLMALATSITGFMFPVTAIKPSHVFGVVTLVLLALHALVVKRLAGRWRTVYVVSAMLTLYLNVVVLVVQMFEKVAPLAELVPAHGPWPLLAVQGAVLALFVAATLLGIRRFQPSPMHLA